MILPLLGKIVGNVAKSIGNKLPGKKPLGKLFKKLTGGGEVKPTGEIIKEQIKQSTNGIVDFANVEKSTTETNQQYINRLAQASGGAFTDFFQNVKKPSNSVTPSDAVVKGAKQAVLKKYLLIALSVLSLLGLFYFIIKKKR